MLRMRIRSFLAGMMGLVLILAGCSGGSTSTGTGSQQSSSGGSAGAKDPVKIGVVNPLTGVIAAYGISAQKGAQVALDEVNAKGGILGGRKVELIFEDDHSTPDGVATAINKLMDKDKVVAVSGGVASSLAIAAKEITRDRILHFVMAAQADDITLKGHKWLFNLNPTVTQYAEPLVQHIRDSAKPKRLAVIVENTDFGRANVETLKKVLTGSNTEIAIIEYFNQTASDFSTSLTKIKATKPDVLYFINGTPAIIPQVWKQAQELGLNIPRYHSAGTLLPGVVKQGAAVADGIITADVWHPEMSNQPNQNFMKGFRAKFNEEPDKAAALAYASIMVLAEAMDKAGSTDSDKVAKYISSNTFQTLMGEAKFDATGRNQGKISLQEISNGALKLKN